MAKNITTHSLIIHTWDTDTTAEQQVLKIGEELMELFAANRKVEREGMVYHITELADEAADVIQATANLCSKYGIDLERAMDRCTERQKKRGLL